MDARETVLYKYSQKRNFCRSRDLHWQLLCLKKSRAVFFGTRLRQCTFTEFRFRSRVSFHTNILIR